MEFLRSSSYLSIYSVVNPSDITFSIFLEQNDFLLAIRNENRNKNEYLCKYVSNAFCYGEYISYGEICRKITKAYLLHIVSWLMFINLFLYQFGFALHICFSMYKLR